MDSVNGSCTKTEISLRGASRAAVLVTLRGALRAALRATVCGVLLIAACAACSPWHPGRTDTRLGANCVRDASRRPLARTINYVDPELCERKVAMRGPYHVRTKPVPVPSASLER